ncbi:MAG: 23S rRNA (pseudouridine(1915)-N(3))-methyltransferase RlmH [Prevotellaceae bacterium]|jgi:23S rRNA (pseudouridine1915-N3)-methyltransferase|nr:23S rRNA (pseudouridine(1915)-N(3))-methyltransferase RlmH [Prevotellaceae bacterium]
MKVIMLVIGKTTDAYLREGIAIYTKRLQHYIPFEIKEIPDVRNAGNLSHAQLKAQEGQLILRQLGANDDLLLLDENGLQFSSEEWSGYLDKKLCYSARSLVFVVGGAFGFSDEVMQRASDKISLSRMTFSHQMARLIFVEQLYRAFTIIKGESYHHP